MFLSVIHGHAVPLLYYDIRNSDLILNSNYTCPYLNTKFQKWPYYLDYDLTTLLVLHFHNDGEVGSDLAYNRRTATCFSCCYCHLLFNNRIPLSPAPLLPSTLLSPPLSQEPGLHTLNGNGSRPCKQKEINRLYWHAEIWKCDVLLVCSVGLRWRVYNRANVYESNGKL